MLDLQQQRRLEALRTWVPIVGGLLLIGYGVKQLADLSSSLEMMLLAIAILTNVLGFVLLALGVVALKLRRWVYSIEERLRRLEEQGGPKG
jgi:hypothetical protein